MITFDRINQTILSIVICSALVLIGAVFFQYILGLNPCKLCIWQRLPHTIAVLIGTLILIKPQFKVSGSLFALISIFLGTILAGYHAGIEAKFWLGPESCSGISNLKELSPELFLQKILTTKVVRCDEVAWSFLNISMAGWNLVISFLLTLIWASVLFFILQPWTPQKP